MALGPLRSSHSPMKTIDVVYPIRKGDNNEELRYSLRSLRNLPHRQVVITGFLPALVRSKGVLFLPTAQDRKLGEYRNVALNLQAAIDSKDVSDPFYLFNDDFYVMVPMEKVRHHNRGPLSELLTFYRAKHHIGTYFRGMEETYQALRSLGYLEPLAFNLHIPILIRKGPMRKALALAHTLKAPHIRTIYGAMAGIKGTKAMDPKRRPGWKQEGWEQWPLLSSTDELKASGVLALLRDTFPGASPYELD